MEYARVLKDIVVAPRRAFDAIRVETPLLLPVLLLVAGYVAVGLAFALTIDLQPAVDETLAGFGEVDAERRQARRDGIELAARVMNALIPAFAGIYGVVLLLLSAIYLWIAGNITSYGGRFRVALSLASWASLPTLIDASVILIAVVVAEPSDAWWTSLDVLAVASLFGLEDTAAAAFLGFSATDPWIVALTAIGCRSLFKASTPTAWVIAIVPFVAVNAWFAF